MATASTADIVNAWFAQRLATGAIARNTEAYNQAQAALADLISQLDSAVSSSTTVQSAAEIAAAQKVAAAAAKIQADKAALAADEAAASSDTANAAA